MRRSLFNPNRRGNRYAIYSAGGSITRRARRVRRSLEARAALSGGMGAAAAIRPGGPSAHRCRLPAPSIFRRSVRPLTTGLERAAQRGSVGTSGTTRALRAKQVRLGGPLASEPTAPRAGSIGRDRRCLSGPLRAAARGGGGEVAPAPAAARGAVGRGRAGAAGEGAGGPSASGRRVRGSVRSLAGGRPKGRRLALVRVPGHRSLCAPRLAPRNEGCRNQAAMNRSKAFGDAIGVQGAASPSHPTTESERA